MPIPTSGLHKVRKPFDKDGERLAGGTIVDVTDWKNAYALVDRGYLVKLTEAELAEQKPVIPVMKAAEPLPSECPKCGALNDEPCRSASGKVTNRHAARG